jgi:hypothetical protein
MYYWLKNKQTHLDFIENKETLEWVSNCCLMPLSSSSAISRWEQVNFQWDDDEVLFVLDQYCVLSGEAEHLIFVMQSQKTTS